MNSDTFLYIINQLLNLGAHLTGSRKYSVMNNSKDWDFMIVGTPQVNSFLTKAADLQNCLDFKDISQSYLKGFHDTVAVYRFGNLTSYQINVQVIPNVKALERKIKIQEAILPLLSDNSLLNRKIWRAAYAGYNAHKSES